MDLILPKYSRLVLAVSGGVDSVTLLDLLTKAEPDNTKLIVAHLDHGIRSDSKLDAELVKNLAKKYKLKFESKTANLPKNTSEASAREVRYNFLYNVAKKYKAEYIVTAHHEDDLIETAIINIIRGTGRKGLTAIKLNKKILRPLLPYTKAQIISYAKKNDLNWREDSTNNDDKYLRNYIRVNFIPKLSNTSREKLLKIINTTAKLNSEIDKNIELILNDLSINQFNVKTFRKLPHDVGVELMASWLRQNNINFDRKTLDKVTIKAKTGHVGQKFPIQNSNYLRLYKSHLALELVER